MCRVSRKIAFVAERPTRHVVSNIRPPSPESPSGYRADRAGRLAARFYPFNRPLLCRRRHRKMGVFSRVRTDHLPNLASGDNRSAALPQQPTLQPREPRLDASALASQQCVAWPEQRDDACRLLFRIFSPRQRSFNWQSTAFVMRGLWVRLPPLALPRRPGSSGWAPVRERALSGWT